MTAAFNRVQHVEGHVLLSLSLLNAKPGSVIPEEFCDAFADIIYLRG
jgi:hypothetical protein